ncbi:MAG TPA: hypothetical protein VK165_07235, partial [Azonexus sp.]|nr:hypothetical protein [Azonexus sp.]
GDRHFVRFAQDRNHLRFGKSALSHDSLSARKPSSQVSAGPKIPGQVMGASTRFANKCRGPKGPRRMRIEQAH